MEFGIGFKEIEHIYGELESGYPSPAAGHKLMEIVNKVIRWYILFVQELGFGM